jgi:hypothetical protein
MGNTQSIAIGIQNNNLVGPHRTGPRNQRRTPTVVNTVFYPNLMWNGRFWAPSGDPFNNSLGFLFPAPKVEMAGKATEPIQPPIPQWTAMYCLPSEPPYLTGFRTIPESVFELKTSPKLRKIELTQQA